MKLKIVCAPNDFENLVVTKVSDVHAMAGKVYLIPENVKTMNEENIRLKTDLKRYQWLSEHRLKGLNHWKRKSNEAQA